MNNLGTRLLLAALLLCGVTSVAQVTTPVDDATLHSAYCIPIVQGFVDLDKKADAELASKLETAQSAQARALLSQEREKLRKLTALEEAELSRLKARMPSALQTEPAALAEATKRGETDRERARTETKQCLDKCVFGPTSYDGSQIKACLRRCSDSELRVRITACEFPSLLSQPPPSSRKAQ